MAAAATTAPLSRGRRILVWILVVGATALALVSILTTWVNRQMLDNTAWKQATTQAIQDPQVQSALATYAVNELYANVNIGQALADRLPRSLKPLGAPIAGALEAPLTQGVQRLLSRPRVQQLFINASTIAHEKLVNVLENKTHYGISTGGGVVTLNLYDMIYEIGTELGIPSGALAKLPTDLGTVTLLKSSQLSAAQAGVQTLKVLSVWLLVAVLFLYGLAIYLARGARRATLRNEGFGLVIVGLIILVLRTLLGNYITDALASPGYSIATHHLWLIGTSILGQIGGATLLYGIITVVGAVFAGPTPIAVRLRGALAPTLNERQGVVWGSVSLIYLLAILWGGTHALRTWWGILLLGGLIAIGVVALRHQTLSEFPSGASDEREPPAPPAPAAEAG